MGAVMNRHSLFISSFKGNAIFLGKALYLFGAVTLFCFKIVMPQYSGGYDASLIDKVERLKSIAGPKIVLIGNSNLSFGIDSERLEQASFAFCRFSSSFLIPSSYCLLDFAVSGLYPVQL